MTLPKSGSELEPRGVVAPSTVVRDFVDPPQDPRRLRGGQVGDGPCQGRRADGKGARGAGGDQAAGDHQLYVRHGRAEACHGAARPAISLST